MMPVRLSLALAACALAVPVAAQEAGPRRTRVGLGPQLGPRYPGADGGGLSPYVDVSRARGDVPFEFEAPDESAGFSVVDRSGFAFGPTFNLQGKRRRQDVGPGVHEVGFTVELGGYVQAQITPAIRARAEVRQGLNGHGGLVAVTGVDYVTRDADRHLFSIGPRLTLSNGRYDRAYFGVTPAEAQASGLAAFRPGGGVQAVGGTAGYLRQFTPRWGVMSYVKYDRLVADPARSPVVRAYGSRNQLSGGLALTYTFGRGL